MKILQNLANDTIIFGLYPKTIAQIHCHTNITFLLDVPTVIFFIELGRIRNLIFHLSSFYPSSTITTDILFPIIVGLVRLSISERMGPLI